MEKIYAETQKSSQLINIYFIERYRPNNLTYTLQGIAFPTGATISLVLLLHAFGNLGLECFKPHTLMKKVHFERILPTFYGKRWYIPEFLRISEKSILKSLLLHSLFSIFLLRYFYRINLRLWFCFDKITVIFEKLEIHQRK